MTNTQHGSLYIYGRFAQRNVGWTRDHDDRQLKRTRGGDLAVGRRTAGVFGNDDINAMGFEQALFSFHVERAAIENDRRAGGQFVRRNRIDAANDVAMPGISRERRDLLPADGEEHAARRIAQRRHGPGHRGNARPAVALDLLPAEPFEPEERNARRRARRAGIGGNPPCEGMGRIDQQVDGLRRKIGLEPRRAAEAAGAHRHGLRRGVERAAGERQRDGKIGPAGKPAREAARLGRAAQYEDAFLVHA